MSKFLLVIPHCLPQTQEIVTNYFAPTAAWWHWSSDVWLLKFNTQKTSAQLRDEMNELLPGVQKLVMRFDDQHSDWAGYGLAVWQDWFRKAWEKQ
jgi:hypothetical protein